MIQCEKIDNWDFFVRWNLWTDIGILDQCVILWLLLLLCVFFQVHYWLLSHSHEKGTFWLWHGIKQKVGLSMTSISKLLEREKEGFTEEKGSLRHKWQRLDFDKSRKTNKITFQFLTCHLLLLVTKDSLQSNVFAYGQPQFWR